MNLKQKIWNLFKQKEDIVDHEFNKRIENELYELNKMVHNIEVAVSDLEKKQTEKIKEYDTFMNTFKELKKYVGTMDRMYSSQINRINERIK